MAPRAPLQGRPLREVGADLCTQEPTVLTAPARTLARTGVCRWFTFSGSFRDYFSRSLIIFLIIFCYHRQDSEASLLLVGLFADLPFLSTISFLVITRYCVRACLNYWGFCGIVCVRPYLKNVECAHKPSHQIRQHWQEISTSCSIMVLRRYVFL